MNTKVVYFDKYLDAIGLEPNHGIYMAAYFPQFDKDTGEVIGFDERLVQDQYGQVDQNEEGPTHYLEFVDFDKDGQNEFLGNLYYFRN